jgi:hypothetical protein
MRIGPVVVYLSRSLWPGLGWHWINGRTNPRILTAIRGRAWVFGRGIVASLGGVQIWATIDEGDSLLAETARRLQRRGC